MRLSSSLKVLALAAALSAPAASAFAWGASGHRVVGVVGAESFPADLPAFLRTPDAVAAIGEYAREPDRWKGSGKLHDTDRDAAHFLDIDDQGRMFGGPAFTVATLPPTRADYEKALQAVGVDSWKAGYLPYSIIDGYQQLVKDFTYWRILSAVVKTEKDATKLAYYKADLKRRQELLIRDLGVWAHYVGDASQPLHMSVHYNGWGQPERIHAVSPDSLPVRGTAGEGRRRREGDQGPSPGLQGLRLLDRDPRRRLSDHHLEAGRAAVSAGKGRQAQRERSARAGVHPGADRRRRCGPARFGGRRLDRQRQGYDRLSARDQRFRR